MHSDYHYQVGNKFPFYFKDKEKETVQVEQKDNKIKAQMLNRFKSKLAAAM